MKKSFLKVLSVAIFAATFLFAINANAQLPKGVFGLYSGLDNEGMHSGIMYTLTDNLEAGLGLQIMSESYTSDADGFEAPDAKTYLGFNVWGAYYLSKGDVNPFLELDVSYMGYPTEGEGDHEKTSYDLGVGLSFGAQAFIVKSFAIYGSVGLYYSMYRMTQNDVTGGTNTFSLFTASLGASFYFTK